LLQKGEEISTIFPKMINQELETENDSIQNDH